MPRPLCSGVTGGSLPVSCTDLREIQYESDLSMSHENVCLQQAGPSHEVPRKRMELEAPMFGPAVVNQLLAKFDRMRIALENLRMENATLGNARINRVVKEALMAQCASTPSQ